MFVFDEKFAEAFFHRKKCYRLFGIELKPFSYWHKVQLEYIQSRILLGGPGLWDYWLAAKVCSTQYPENVMFPAQYGKWWSLFWRLRHGGRSLLRAAREFSAYLEDYASPPKMWSGPGGSKKKLAEALSSLARLIGDESVAYEAHCWDAAANAGPPRTMDDSIEQIAIFVKHAGAAPEKAWNMPMGALLWYNACFLQMEGVEVPIWTPADQAAYDQHALGRQQKIEKIADEIAEEQPNLTREILVALAAVKYWRGVVEDQKDLNR